MFHKLNIEGIIPFLSQPIHSSPKQEGIPMSIFQQTLEQSDERFLRDVGISKATFQQLLDKVATYLAVQREKNPMKKRGLKSTISIADQLLLTLTYLRHYPTFAKLGKEFSISESYANKIYHRMLDILVRVLPMNSKKELLRSDLDSVVIDVTEQPIERPKQQQCHYYSGKKMPYSQSPTDYLLGEFADSIGHLSKGQSPRFLDTQRKPSTYQPRDREAS